MINYLCKYTPIELIYGLGETPSPLFPDSGDTQEAAVHPNLCSFAKAVSAACLNNADTKIVFTNCCDSVKRVADVLKDKCGYSALLNVPRTVTPESVSLFAGELLDFIRGYEEAFSVSFDPAAFRSAFTDEEDALAGQDYIALLGARCPAQLLSALRESSPLPVRDLTCTGQARAFGSPPETDGLGALIKWYAGKLLTQPPCMRMQDVTARRAFAEDPHARGIVYHTIKFCDYYGFEYAALKEETSLPVLKLETDYTGAADGQLMTRMDAFFESMGGAHAPAPPKPQIRGKVYAGIDSGSTSTDAVLLSEDLSILAYSILPTGGRSVEGARAALADVLAKCGLKEEDIADIVVTGYGRNSAGMGRPVTEITCHAKGAFFQSPAVRTIVDVGGQDSKIIKLDETGNIIDFSMNDKCAAGTGRFLEMMANTLGMDLTGFTLTGLTWEEDIRISSMCSVFAESEVISLIAQNKKKPDIIHGINASITTRIHAMVSRLNCSPAYMMTGGVAKNQGVVAELSGKLGEKILLPDEPQICGALGAALIAAKK